jgi:hypothetical protein
MLLRQEPEAVVVVALERVRILKVLAVVVVVAEVPQVVPVVLAIPEAQVHQRRIPVHL